MKTRYRFAKLTVGGVEQLGSDALVVLDGRFGSQRALQQCREHAERLRGIRRYDGVNVYASRLGDYSNPAPAFHAAL